MSIRHSMAAALAVLLPVVASCQNGGPSNPVAPRTSIEGKWTGDATDEAYGRGHAVLEITALPFGITGTWSFSFPDSEVVRRGSVGGAIVNGSVSWAMTPSTPVECDYGALSGTMSLTGTIDNGRLRGTYLRFTCDGAATGSLDVTRTE